MNHLKKQGLLAFALTTGLLLSGCENSMMDEPLVSEEILETQVAKSQFNLNQLPQVTDYSNLREGNFTGRYLILSKSGNLDKTLALLIEKAGGEVVKSFPEVGVAVAISKSPAFLDNARAINGIESVTPDFFLQYTQEPTQSIDAVELASDISTAAIGTPFDYQSAFYDGFQWAPASINAPAAWDKGVTGEGIKVAIIDGGIYSSHIDIAPNLDVANSISTVPGFNFNQDVGTTWHGTHVAGIVASSGLATVGIAPKATIIGVKSLHNGSGAFEWILEGILYAATPQSLGGAGANIINMSLGAEIDIKAEWKDKEFRDAFKELQKIYDRATRYAYQNGVTVVVSAGNGASNYDVEREFFKIPAQNQHVISVSSTGPTGWQLGNTNFTDPAYYTDYGKSLVDVAGPGGSAGLLVVEGNGSSCTLTGSYIALLRPCYAFDMVFSPVRGAAASVSTYGWLQGTSMAAPAVAGVIALMMEASGGKIQPGFVKTRLQSSATDLGTPGNDAYYGQGFVNAAKAIGLE